MPSIYPSGVTIYDPDECWDGFTVHSGGNLIDMNGNLVKEWEKISQLGKILPGGHILGDVRHDGPRFERGRKLVQLDWNGNKEWEFRKTEQIEVKNETIWSAKQHHDFQREGNPVGYYAPDMDPEIKEGKTLVLASRETKCPEIAPGPLLDDCILEIDWNGEVLWEWSSCDHFDEMGFGEAAKNAIHRRSKHPDPEQPWGEDDQPYDWLHSNSISYLGPNKWYDEGDDRFHPENIIWDARHTNTIGIIDRETGEFTWRIGPDYSRQELQDIGQIIGQHHAHMIPKGLPGEGNILVFDNGGYAGYGEPNPGAHKGIMNAVRPYSRVLEIDPIELELRWEYKAENVGYHNQQHYRFYSPYISSAQRLPNGNTLICEGNKGCIFEVTKDLKTVWEFVVPPSKTSGYGEYSGGNSYRAYRIPYDWIPQVDKPGENPVYPPEPSELQIDPEPCRKPSEDKSA